MTIRLTVDRTRWWSHVTDVAETVTGLIPVVKGNGYGFGRSMLAELALPLNKLLAVGTIYELEGLPAKATPIVLTPTVSAPRSTKPVLTVSHPLHIKALAGWGGRVIVKLESDMHRYGGGIDLVYTAQQAGLRTVGVAIHPPLAGDDDAHREQIVRWLPEIDPSLDVWVSHLSPVTYETLPTTHRYKLRLGTYLWHGDRESLQLQANVLDTKPIEAGQAAGYRLQTVDRPGTLVMIGAGSANGVALLPDGQSPFHFERQRMELLEPPHMHTSMAYVPVGEPTPGIGGWVDLQRPLTMTTVDQVRWI